jgi:hypothetical protein
MNKTYSVLILDMFHYQDPEHEYTIGGFSSVELATEFARRWVRDSVEELRADDWTPEGLRSQWFTFGEDAMVIGGNWRSLDELDAFINHPATPEERDWKAIKIQAGVEPGPAA